MIILLPRRLIRPSGTAEHRQPIVGHGAVILGIGPDVPVFFQVITVAAGGEPGMLVGGVRQHFVQNELQAFGMGSRDQRLKVIERAVIRMHAFIIRNVITPVAVGRWVNGGQPDRVHAQAGDIIEFGNKAGEIALPVAIAVAETADIDLIDDRATPPGETHSTLPLREGRSAFGASGRCKRLSATSQILSVIACGFFRSSQFWMRKKL